MSACLVTTAVQVFFHGPLLLPMIRSHYVFKDFVKQGFYVQIIILIVKLMSDSLSNTPVDCTAIEAANSARLSSPLAKAIWVSPDFARLPSLISAGRSHM